MLYGFPKCHSVVKRDCSALYQHSYGKYKSIFINSEMSIIHLDEGSESVTSDDRGRQTDLGVSCEPHNTYSEQYCAKEIV